MSTTPSPARRRAVFIDVDGTLMKDGHFVPPSAVTAIRAARAARHLVFLSTGRGMAELRGPVLDIGFDGAVTNGGAYGSIGEHIIVSRLLTESEVAHLEERFRFHGVQWYFQTYEGLFPSPDLPALMAAYLERDRIRHESSGTDAPFFSVGMKEFEDPANFVAGESAKAVILSDDTEAVAAVLAELRERFAVVGGTIPLPAGASGEVARAGVNKGATILDLLAHVDIDPADAIGIGDNWNDAEMFEVCGLSIAMGNAARAVQALADEVTAPIDDDGLHAAFARHGLL